LQHDKNKIKIEVAGMNLFAILYEVGTSAIFLRVIALEREFYQSDSLSTRPDIGTLVDPLFSFAGKRVREFFFHPFSNPLFPPQAKRGWSGEA
jgi:hypothetical protein